MENGSLSSMRTKRVSAVHSSELANSILSLASIRFFAVVVIK
jgi:hypothetical protein